MSETLERRSKRADSINAVENSYSVPYAERKHIDSSAATNKAGMITDSHTSIANTPQHTRFTQPQRNIPKTSAVRGPAGSRADAAARIHCAEAVSLGAFPGP